MQFTQIEKHMISHY